MVERWPCSCNPGTVWMAFDVAKWVAIVARLGAEVAKWAAGVAR